MERLEDLNQDKGSAQIGGRRNVALDILRGITITVMIIVNAIPDFEVTPAIMLHAPWEGITIPDLAFPGFVFCMGASAAFTIERRANESWVGKVLKRTVLLFALGMVLNSMSAVFALLLMDGYTLSMFCDSVFVHGRILGVLQRLAITYMFGMGIALLIRSKAGVLIAAACLLLFSSAGFHLYSPDAPFDKTHNVSLAVDYVVPGVNHIYQGYGFPFDPEGLYGIFASVASMLLGVWAGRMMQEVGSEGSKAGILLGGGIATVLCGLLWGCFDLIGKPLWTAPFALLNAGGDMIVLAFLVWLMGVAPNFQYFLRPFYALGRNPLFFYLASETALIILCTIVVSPDGVSVYYWLWENITRGIVSVPFSSVLHAVLWCLMWWPVAEFMYRRNIIIRL